MSTYLLTCQCGKTIPVEVGQAGGRVACDCGAQVDVPTLRKLRHLPIAKPDAGSHRSAWNARKGVAAAGIILTCLFAAYALWNRVTEPKVVPFDPAARTNIVNERLDTMTPLQCWTMWIEIYQPLAKTGFGIFEDPHNDAVERIVAHRRGVQTALLIIAAVCALVAAAAAFWRSGTSRQA
jgi:hypothetical protein